jgi:hypothetical protein
LEDHHGGLDLSMTRLDGKHRCPGGEQRHGSDADNTGDRLGEFVRALERDLPPAPAHTAPPQQPSGSKRPRAKHEGGQQGQPW